MWARATCVAAVLLVAETSCTTYVAMDRLDAVVVSSFLEGPRIRPECVRVADHINDVWRRTRHCRLLSGQMGPGDSVKFFLLALSAKDLRTPLGGKKVSLRGVDRDGVLLPDGALVITPTWVLTGSDGRNAEPIRVTTQKPGEYRIELSYDDRGRSMTGISPPLHVLSTAPAPH